jgi:hypothetical protein
VLQHWWLDFNFGVMIFMLKKMRRGMPSQKNNAWTANVKNAFTVMGVTGLHVEVCSALLMEVFH